MILWYNNCLVDLFDFYDQWANGVVDKYHLDMRMNAISSGMLKTRIGLNCWNFWEQSRDEKFIMWFELEVFDEKPGDEFYVQNTENLNVFRE